MVLAGAGRCALRRCGGRLLSCGEGRDGAVAARQSSRCACRRWAAVRGGRRDRSESAAHILQCVRNGGSGTVSRPKLVVAGIGWALSSRLLQHPGVASGLGASVALHSVARLQGLDAPALQGPTLQAVASCLSPDRSRPERLRAERLRAERVSVDRLHVDCLRLDGSRSNVRGRTGVMRGSHTERRGTATTVSVASACLGAARTSAQPLSHNAPHPLLATRRQGRSRCSITGASPGPGGRTQA